MLHYVKVRKKDKSEISKKHGYASQNMTCVTLKKSN